MSDYQDLRARIKELKDQIKDEVKTFFTEEAEKLFRANPNLQSFAWTQYTPYFNDGDACYFGVRDDPEYDISVNGVRGSNAGPEYPSNAKYGSPAYKQYESLKKEALVDHYKVAEFLQQFDEEDMKTMFGDHVKVTVHRDGNVEIDDWDHE